MSCNGVRGRKPCLDQTGERAVMAAGSHRGDLRLALRDMDEDTCAGSFGASSAILEQGIRAGVERMRRNAGRYPGFGIGAVTFDQALDRGPVGRSAIVGDRVADDRSNARLLDHWRDMVHVAQPVGDAGDAVQEELRTRSPHRRLVVLEGEALLSGYRIAGPEGARSIVGQAAKECRGGMGVHVDEARRHQRFTGVDHLVARTRKRAGRANGGDRSAVDTNVGGRQELVDGVDGEHRAALKHDCHVRLCSGTSPDAGRGERWNGGLGGQELQGSRRSCANAR